MRAMNTLYVTGHRSVVRYDRGTCIVADPDNGRTRVPLNTLDGLVLLGQGQVTSQMLSQCARRGIRVAALSRSGRVRFTCGGPVSGNVHLRVAQYRAADDSARAAAISREVVAGKIQNCRRLLARWSWDASDSAKWVLNRTQERLSERLRNVSPCDEPDRLRGIEGDASRRYFQGLRAILSRTQWSFTARTRRPPDSPVNALLSYIYGLLVIELSGHLDAVGLDPQVGFLHGIRPGRPSLALDLVEEFRPAVADRFVVGLLRRRQVAQSDFTTTPGNACYLTDDGRRKVLAAYERFKDGNTRHPLLDRTVPRWSLPAVQATLMARHLRGDIPNYPPYVLAD